MAISFPSVLRRQASGGTRDGRASLAVVGGAAAILGLAALAPTTAYAVQEPTRTPAPRGTSLAASTLVRIADAGPSIAAENPVTAPLKWAGLWYRNDGEGHTISCTAQFVSSRVILLAAHCIRNQNTGEFYPTPDNRAGFLLQYQNRDFSKAYHVVCKATWNGWVAPIHPGEDPDNLDAMTPERKQEYLAAYRKSWQWDYGFVLLDADSLTGHYNYSLDTRWDGAVSTGYPGKLMGGEVIQVLRGDVFPEAEVSYSQGDEQNEQILWHGNPDHTQGASGGAWVVHFDSKVSPDTNLIVGLNSYGVDNKPGANFGPLFTKDFQTLLDYVQNGCK